MNIDVNGIEKIEVSDIEEDNIYGEVFCHRAITLYTDQGKVLICLHGSDLKFQTEKEDYEKPKQEGGNCED